jgi:peptide deformylase
VKRRNKIVVSAYDLLNHQQTTVEAEGILSICMQHEIDHLSGILYYDRISKDHPEAVGPD